MQALIGHGLEPFHQRFRILVICLAQLGGRKAAYRELRSHFGFFRGVEFLEDLEEWLYEEHLHLVFVQS